jgi:preprotein translocase subunit SecG
MFYLLLIILMVIVAILMCCIVLIQNSKGGGLAAGFSSSNAIMGVRKTTDFLEKATWTLAAAMVVISVAAAWSVPTATIKSDAILEQAQQEEQTNPYNLPAGTNAPATKQDAAAAPAADGNAAATTTTGDATTGDGN